MMMSAPAPLWTAAVTRAWMSFWLIRSTWISTPACFANSSFCLSKRTSAAGTKWDHWRRWSRVPFGYAGAWAWARMPPSRSIVPAPATAAAPFNTVRLLTWAMMSPPASTGWPGSFTSNRAATVRRFWTVPGGSGTPTRPRSSAHRSSGSPGTRISLTPSARGSPLSAVDEPVHVVAVVVDAGEGPDVDRRHHAVLAVAPRAGLAEERRLEQGVGRHQARERLEHHGEAGALGPAEGHEDGRARRVGRRVPLLVEGPAGRERDPLVLGELQLARPPPRSSPCRARAAGGAGPAPRSRSGCCGRPPPARRAAPCWAGCTRWPAPPSPRARP